MNNRSAKNVNFMTKYENSQLSFHTFLNLLVIECKCTFGNTTSTTLILLVVNCNM